MIADAYFVCRPESFEEYNMLIMPDNDVLPLCNIVHSKGVYFDAEKVICHCRIDCPLIQEMKYQTELEDPFCLEAVSLLDIGWTYLGRTISGVYERFPELIGFETIEGEERPIVMEHVWA